MITETDAGYIVYDDLSQMGLEMRLKGHLKKGSLEGEAKMVDESVPEKGMIVIIPKRVSANKTYFNDCTIEVNILVPDLDGETSPNLNELMKSAMDILSDDKVGESGEWYRYSIQSHGIEQEENLECHYANITLHFEILNIRR